MSEGKTGGQRAYEAWLASQSARIGFELKPDWDALNAGNRDDWEAAAVAGAGAAHERTAELVSEVNELLGLLGKVEAALLEGGQDHASKARKAITLIARSGLLRQAHERGSLSDAEPAVVTSGTEHLAELIGGLAIGGEDTP